MAPASWICHPGLDENGAGANLYPASGYVVRTCQCRVRTAYNWYNFCTGQSGAVYKIRPMSNQQIYISGLQRQKCGSICLTIYRSKKYQEKHLEMDFKLIKGLFKYFV